MPFITKLFFPVLLLSSFSFSFSSGDARTAYDVLQRYNFPKGLLPVGAQSYLLREDGTFEVFFAETCEFKVKDKYLLRYKTIISGTVEKGALRDLKGVSVRVLFLWIGITDVVQDDDQLRFYVGPFSKSFPVSDFAECPRCRDLDHNNKSFDLLDFIGIAL